MKTKIVFLIGSFEAGGKERQLAEIIKNLPQNHFEIHLFVKSIKAHYFSETEITSHIRSVYSLNRNNFRFADILELTKYLNKVRPDVIFSFSNILSHFCLVARIFSKAPFKLINGSIRDAPVKLDFSQRMESVLLKLHGYVVSNSKAGLKSYYQLGKPGRFVLYNGYDFNRSATIPKRDAQLEVGFGENCFNVVMVASLRKCYSKDPMTFLQVAAHSMKIDANLKFYLVGDGEKRAELEAYGVRHKITNVEFLGLRNDVETILRASDISVLTSKTEGISNFILESMACGIPVVTTSMGGTPEIIEDGVNGCILSFGDYIAVSKKIKELKDNPDRLQELGDNAKLTVRSKFSMEAMIQNFIQIVEKILDSR